MHFINVSSGFIFHFPSLSCIVRQLLFLFLLHFSHSVLSYFVIFILLERWGGGRKRDEKHQLLVFIKHLT